MNLTSIKILFHRHILHTVATLPLIRKILVVLEEVCRSVSQVMRDKARKEHKQALGLLVERQGVEILHPMKGNRGSRKGAATTAFLQYSAGFLLS